MLILASASAGLASCEVVTHAFGFRPYQGVCNLCDGGGDLLRPPCPSDVAPDDADGGSASCQRRVYALRCITFGGNTDGGSPCGQIAGASDNTVGLNQDCMDRSGNGRPAACEPRTAPSTCCPLRLIPIPEWVPLPHGIDNSIGQRVIGPLEAYGRSVGVNIDIDGTVSRGLDQGAFGSLVVIDNWNGTPDDADVEVAFLGATWSQQALPQWKGQDLWTGNGGLAGYPHFRGYVSGGVLVVDTRQVGEDFVTVSVQLGGQGPAIPFVVVGRLMVRVGPLTPEKLVLTTYGRWNLDDAVSQVPGVVGLFLPDGGAIAQGALNDSLIALMYGGADLPLGEHATPGVPCASLSLTLRAEAYPAQLVELVDGGCL